jgi:hypothetical protein
MNPFRMLLGAHTLNLPERLVHQDTRIKGKTVIHYVRNLRKW